MGRVPVAGSDLWCPLYDEWPGSPAIEIARASALSVSGWTAFPPPEDPEEKWTFAQRLDRARGQFQDGEATWIDGECVVVKSPTFPEWELDISRNAIVFTSALNRPSVRLDRSYTWDQHWMIFRGRASKTSTCCNLLWEIRVEYPSPNPPAMPSPQTWIGGNESFRDVPFPEPNAYGYVGSVPNFLPSRLTTEITLASTQTPPPTHIPLSLRQKQWDALKRCQEECSLYMFDCTDFLCALAPVQPSNHQLHSCSLPDHLQSALQVVSGLLVGTCQWSKEGKNSVRMRFSSATFKELYLDIVFALEDLLDLQQDPQPLTQHNRLGTTPPTNEDHFASRNDVVVERVHGSPELIFKKLSVPSERLGFYLNTCVPSSFGERLLPKRACKKPKCLKE